MLLFNSLTLAIATFVFYLVFLVFFLFIYWESRKNSFYRVQTKKRDSRINFMEIFPFRLINKTFLFWMRKTTSFFYLIILRRDFSVFSLFYRTHRLEFSLSIFINIFYFRTKNLRESLLFRDDLF
jgi:hypothetical protein